MRHTAAALFAALVCSAAATQIVAASDTAVPAAPAEKTFLIPAAEGYGVGECLTGGNNECGQVVANAWCESQGFASATSFGTAAQEDYTGAIDTLPAKPAERPIRITCKD